MIFVRVKGHDHSSAHVAESFPCLLGRSLKCDIRIDEASVSARHARIDQRGDVFVLQDLGSTNGILHNGHRVAEVILKKNETVLLGDVEVQLTFDEPLLKTKPSARVDVVPETSARKLATLTLMTLIVGYVLLCMPPAADFYAEFWPPDRPQEIASAGFVLWLFALGAAFIVSLFCKLNTKRFHFHRIFGLMVATIFMSQLLDNLMGTVVFNLHNLAFAPFLWHIGYAAIAFWFVYRLQRYAFSRWRRRLRALVAAAFAVLTMVAIQITNLSARGSGDRTDITELGLPIVDPARLATTTSDMADHLKHSAELAERERQRVLKKIMLRQEEDDDKGPREAPRETSRP